MYIRTVSRKNKDGSVVRYVQLAHNEWDSEAGYSKVHVIHTFGREDELDTDALRRLARSIGRFLGPEEALRLEASRGTTSGLRFVSSRPLGGAWLLDQLWSRLGIRSTIEGLLRERGFTTPVERAIFAMVANRALAPRSKLAVEEWVADEVAIPGLDDVPVQQLYRAMDFLLELDERLQKEVFFSVADLLNLEVDLLYFDTTSTYFETEDEDPDEDGKTAFRKRGHSKDHRPDLPQAVIGLAVTRDGIPVRVWAWPGNTSDMSVVAQVKKDLVGWRLGRVITVVDRGFSSEDNLRELQRTGGHYIAGERMRSGKPVVEEALSRPGRYQTVRDNLELKEIVVGDGEARVRYVLARNPREEERDREARDRTLKRLREELAHLAGKGGSPHPKAACELMASQAYAKYLKLDKRGRPRIDRDKVRAEERLDGKYLIRTSDDTLSAEDVALGYKQLLEVEDAFRTLKTTLSLRPVYHRLEDRIRAHILLCWLALLLVRVAERGTGQTWRVLRDRLERMHLVEFSGDDGRVLQRTETTVEQKQIFSTLKVPEPPRILGITATSAKNPAPEA